MLDTKDFELKLQEFVSQSKIVRGKKDAIETIIHGAYAMVCDYRLQRFTRPQCNMGFRNMSFLLSEFRNKERELLNACVQALLNLYAENEPFTDVLTEIYGQFLGYDNGQHMTPPDLADLIVMLTLDSDVIVKNFTGSHSINIGDPTGCGTGAMILASIRHIYGNYGKEAISYCNFVGVELDRTLAMASVVQIELGSMFHNIQFNRLEIYNENAIVGNMNKENLLYGVVPNMQRYRKEKFDELPLAA